MCHCVSSLVCLCRKNYTKYEHLFLSLSPPSASSISPGLGFFLRDFTSFSLFMYHTLLSTILTSINISFSLSISPSFPLSHPLLAPSLTCWLEVNGIVSQGRPCLRSHILMPGWLSETDSSVPVGDHQTFSDCDHRPPWWIDPMCSLSLFTSTAVRYKKCDMERKREENKGVTGRMMEYFFF